MSTLITILAWIGGIFGGLIVLIFLSLYIRGAFRDSVIYTVENPPSLGDPRLPLVLASLSNSVITHGAITDFWAEPDHIQKARLKAISQAKKTIHFETFFFTPGKRADDFAIAIADRAMSGVEVKLLVDSFGAIRMPRNYWKRLKATGVQVKFFNSFNWKAPANYAGRTHRKLLSIDGEFALIGGAGISDFWDGLPEIGDTQPWFDIEFCLEGEIVTVLEGMFIQHWTYSGGIGDLGEHLFDFAEEKDLMIATAGSNPTYRFSPIRAITQNTLVSARKSIWIASPYFLPEPNSRQLLINAKKEGLDVRILTTSVRNDKKWVYYASYEIYGELLEEGVEIYQYMPSMIHAKMLLVDDFWVKTGSANFDPRSFFHNDELDISTSDKTLVYAIKQAFERAFEDSQKVTLEEWQKRSFWKNRILGNLVSFVQWQL